MIKSNLSDLDKSKMIFNFLLREGVIEFLIGNMRPLDDLYTVGFDRHSLAKLVLKEAASFETEVTTYRPFWRWSSAYATTYTGNFNLIKINQYKISRAVASLCGSIAHEWGHCLEYYFKSENEFSACCFNHGDNDPIGKEDTFQYQLGKAVKAYVGKYEEEILRNIGIK